MRFYKGHLYAVEINAVNEEWIYDISVDLKITKYSQKATIIAGVND